MKRKYALFLKDIYDAIDEIEQFTQGLTGLCIQGKYTLLSENKEIDLMPGDEYVISKGQEHACRRTTGTKTIHAFGGKGIQQTQTP